MNKTLQHIETKEKKLDRVLHSTKERVKLLDRKRKGRKSGRRTGQKALSLPPGLESSVIIGHTFRFRCLSDISSTPVTVGALIGICGVIGTSTTKVDSIASSVKLRGVTIWPAAEADTATANNPEIAYDSAYGTTADKTYVKSIPGGVTSTAPIHSRPGKDTLGALWQNSAASATRMFVLYDINKGSIIDVAVTYTLRNAVPGLQYTVATATVGSMYYLYLTSTLQPVALPNTT